MATASDFGHNVEYLRDVQYRDTSELAKRANLHVTYRTAPELAFDWLAGRTEWPDDGGSVLDVGCGGGYLWRHVADVAPPGLDLTLCDLSPGMVDEAVATARATAAFATVEGRVADARELPFPDDSFDVVASTYVLYHVPEPSRAVAELARVVRPAGTVVIMTNGPGHLLEIERMLIDVFGSEAAYRVNDSFSPAVAGAHLVEHFDEVVWSRYDDTLAVTDAEAVLAFATSTPPANGATLDQRAELLARIEATMDAADGVFTVSKHTGAFWCRAPRSPTIGP